MLGLYENCVPVYTSGNPSYTDPAGQGNHIIDWEVKEIAEQESEKFKRWIKESIQIRANKILTTNIKKN